MRKIISIAAYSESESFWPHLVALCDDGSVWEAMKNRNGSYDPWERTDVKPIPQEDTPQ